MQTQVLSKLAFKADFWMQVCRLLSAQHQGSAVFVWKKGGSVLPIFATPWSFDHRKRTLKIGFLSPLQSDLHISEPKKWSSLFVCIFSKSKITHHYQSQTHEDATTQSTCFKIRRKCGDWREANISGVREKLLVRVSLYSMFLALANVTLSTAPCRPRSWTN